MYANKNYANRDYTTVSKAHYLHLPKLGYWQAWRLQGPVSLLPLPLAEGCPYSVPTPWGMGKNQPSQKGQCSNSYLSTLLGLTFTAPVKQACLQSDSIK